MGYEEMGYAIALLVAMALFTYVIVNEVEKQGEETRELITNQTCLKESGDSLPQKQQSFALDTYPLNYV